jgi:hypothetical protein
MMTWNVPQQCGVRDGAEYGRQSNEGRDGHNDLIIWLIGEVSRRGTIGVHYCVRLLYSNDRAKGIESASNCLLRLSCILYNNKCRCLSSGV